MHIYLQPGLYTVTMKVSGESDALANTNRVPIHRALIFPEPNHQPDQLAAYLTVLDKYDAAKLEPAALLQLVRAFEEGGQHARAARAGQAGILAEPRADRQPGAMTLVRTVDTLLRERLDDAAGAFKFCRRPSRCWAPRPGKRNATSRRHLAINDLAHAEPARALLDSATKRLEKDAEPALASRLHRVWGDWYARKGDRSSRGPPMREQPPRWTAENRSSSKTPGDSAVSRSTENFSTTRRGPGLDRAPRLARAVPYRQGRRLPHAPSGPLLGGGSKWRGHRPGRRPRRDQP